MKINFHPKLLSLYATTGEFIAFKKFNLFEDMDETFLTFNVNLTKHNLIKFEIEMEEISKKNKNKEIYYNFYSEYFK